MGVAQALFKHSSNSPYPFCPNRLHIVSGHFERIPQATVVDTIDTERPSFYLSSSVLAVNCELDLSMELKHKATNAYRQLAEFHENRGGYTPETQSYFLSDVLSDLADAAKTEGCQVVVPENPSSIQAINVVNEILEWARDANNELF